MLLKAARLARITNSARTLSICPPPPPYMCAVECVTDSPLHPSWVGRDKIHGGTKTCRITTRLIYGLISFAAAPAGGEAWDLARARHCELDNSGREIDSALAMAIGVLRAASNGSSTTAFKRIASGS